MRWLCLTALLSASLLHAGGALIFDGVDDWLDCAPIAFDLVRDQGNTVVWVRPNFTPARLTDSVVFSNTNLLSGGLGTEMRWDGITQRFVFLIRDPVASFGGVRLTCGAANFLAGDLLGIEAWVSNNTQQCEIFNVRAPNTGGSTSSSFFGGFVLNTNSPANLEIGSRLGGTAVWDGEIDMITISNKRMLNVTSNYLQNRRKLLFYPMQPSDRLTSPPGGYADYIAAYNFYEGAMGSALNVSVRDVAHAAGFGIDCSVGGLPATAPMVTGSAMLY